MPDGPSEMVITRTPLSSLLKRFSSLTFILRSSRADKNLEEAEVFIEITERQIAAIRGASQQVNKTFAMEIIHIERGLDKIKPWLNIVKGALECQSGPGQTSQRLISDSVTKDIRIAAQKLSRKATRTSARVAAADNSSRANISLQIAPSSDPCNTGKSRAQSDDTSNRLSPQSRTSAVLGDRAVLNHCPVIIINIQSNDNSAISGATSNLGVDVMRRDLLDTPPPPSAVHGSPSLSCGVSQDARVIQENNISLQDAAVEIIRSVLEQFISAASSSQAQSSNPPVNTQPVSQAGIGEGVAQQVSPLIAAGTQNVRSHSLTVSGSAKVLSPTMNFNSPGATGATNTYLGPQPVHSPPPQASTQNRHLEGSGFKCMEFAGNSVVYNPTLNDESANASGAYNQEIPAAGS